MVRLLVRNVAANWIGFAVQAAVTFFLTPMVLGAIGEVRYGVFVLSMSLIGYYGLLDFGLRAGATQYLTRYLATRDFDKVNGAVSTVFVILAIIGGSLAALSLAIAYGAPSIFQIPEELRAEVFWSVLLMGLSAAVQCVLFPFSAVFVATQRYDVANAIGVSTRLLSAAAAWWVLTVGYGLIALSLVFAIVNVIDYTARWIIAYRILPQLKVSPRLATWTVCREVVAFSMWNFLIAINTAVTLHADALVIGVFLPVSAVAIYALAGNLVRYLTDGLGAARQVAYPAAAQLHALRDTSGLRRLYLGGSQMLLLVAILVAVIAGVWAGDFFRLWVGGDNLSDGDVQTVTLLFRVILIAVILDFVPGTASHILLGAGYVKVLSVVALAQAMINLILTAILVQFYGLIGVALGTVIASLIKAILTIQVASKQLSIPKSTFALSVIPRPAVVCVALLALSLIIRKVSTPTSWAPLAFQGFIAAVAGVGLVLIVGLDKTTKGRLVQQCRAFFRKSARYAKSRKQCDVAESQ